MPVMQEIRPEGKETKTERSADVARIISLGRGFIQSAVPSANVVLDSEFAKYAPLFQSEVLKTMDSDKAKALYEEYKGRFSLQHPVKVVTRQVPGPNDVGAYYAPLNQNLRVVRVLPPVYRQMRTLNEAGPEACRLIDAFLNTSKSNDVHSKTKNRMYAAEIANIYSTLGSEVNIFARSSFLKELSPKTKKYVLEKIMSDVNIYENTNIAEAFEDKVLTEAGDELEGTPFFATGRTPNSEIAEGIVELNDDKSIKVNEMMKTSVDNIYAAGDVTGGYQLTPVARKEGITAARNMAGYGNKMTYECIPQTLSLNTEVSFVENEKSQCSDDDKATIAIPGIAGPSAFWNILIEKTGFTEVEFDKAKNKINRISHISPSSVSDVAYLSYLMRMDYDLDDYSEFIEIHPSTDTNYKIIKNMWL